MYDSFRAFVQAALFGYFSSTLDAVVLDAKTRGAYDDGIVALKGMSSVKLTHEAVIHTDAASGAPCPVHHMPSRTTCSQ